MYQALHYSGTSTVTRLSPVGVHALPQRATPWEARPALEVPFILAIRARILEGMEQR